MLPQVSMLSSVFEPGMLAILCGYTHIHAAASMQLAEGYGIALQHCLRNLVLL